MRLAMIFADVVGGTCILLVKLHPMSWGGPGEMCTSHVLSACRLPARELRFVIELSTETFSCVCWRPRSGGYTRVLATRIRQGDAAPLAYIEWVFSLRASDRLIFCFTRCLAFLQMFEIHMVFFYYCNCLWISNWCWCMPQSQICGSPEWTSWGETCISASTSAGTVSAMAALQICANPDSKVCSCGLADRKSDDRGIIA